MSASLTVSNGAVRGGNRAERLTLKLLWLFSWLLAPIRFRGLWRICRIVCHLTGVRKRQWVLLPSGLRFSIDPGDPYWNRLISPRHHYEPELDWLLDRLRRHDYCFIDCGANFGYWSCHAASGIYGGKAVYAIEPLQENFNLLEQHLAANDLAAHCYHNALCEHSGKSVSLYKPGGNASVSIVSTRPDSPHQEQVESLTLDSLMADLPPAPTEIVIKLDVEEAEIPTLKGAEALLKRQPLIVYEDHGQDDTSRVSEFILRELDYAVYYVEEDGTTQAVQDMTAVRRIKQRKDKGYNFFAFAKGSHWTAIFS